jgi:hypothetical protein
MNLHLKNLKLLSPLPPSSTECLTISSPTKIPMRINTDTQKALEHLRELASNPSELERIQTLSNNPNLIQEIRKIANQSFIDQLKTLPPFAPANLQQATNESLAIENKSNSENHEQSKLEQTSRRLLIYRNDPRNSFQTNKRRYGLSSKKYSAYYTNNFIVSSLNRFHFPVKQDVGEVYKT